MEIKYTLFALLLYVTLVFSQETDSTKTDTSPKLMSANAYAKLFKERRRDGKNLLEIVNNEGAYERKYKLLEGAYNKLLDILQQTQIILQAAEYDPLSDKFPPQDVRLFDAITVTLENTCLFGEIILHNPDISYRVLDARQFGPDWKDLINWCIKYTRQYNDRIIDTKSQELLWLLEQEINPDKRTENFINPYRSTSESKPKLKKKKTKKKLDKGPRMVTRDEF